MIAYSDSKRGTDSTGTMISGYVQYDDVTYSITDFQVDGGKREPHYFSCYWDDFFEWVVRIVVVFVAIMVYWYVRRIGRQTVWTGRNYNRRWMR